MPIKKRQFVTVQHDTTDVKLRKQPYESIERSKREIILNNLLGGIAWGLGATVGASLIIALLGFIFRTIGIVPVFGSFIIEITKYVTQHVATR